MPSCLVSLSLLALTALPLIAGEAATFAPSQEPPRITGRADRVVDYSLSGEPPLTDRKPARLRVFFRGGQVDNAWVWADVADGVVVREQTFNDGIKVRGQDPARMPLGSWHLLKVEEGRLRGPLWLVHEGRDMSQRTAIDIDLSSGAGTWTGGPSKLKGPPSTGAITVAAEHDVASLGKDEDPLRPGYGWPQAKGVDGLGSAVPIERPIVAGLGEGRFVWKSQARLPFFYCGSSSPVADGDLVVVTHYQPTGTLAFTSGGRKFSAEQPKGEVPYDWRQRLLVHADDVVIGIDARSGLTRWRTELPLRAVNFQGDQKSMPGNTCAIASGRVFAAGFGGQVYALDASTGALLWEADLGPASMEWRKQAGLLVQHRSAKIGPPEGPGKGLGHSDGVGLGKPVVVGNVAVFNAGSRELHAFAADSGRRLWSDPAAFLGWRGFARVLRRPDGSMLLAYPRIDKGATFALVDPRSGARVAEYPLPFPADGNGVWLVWRDLLVHVPVALSDRNVDGQAAQVRAWRIGDKELTPAFTADAPGCAGAASLAIVHGSSLLFGGHRQNAIAAVDLESGRFLGPVTGPRGQGMYHELSAGYGYAIRPSFSWAAVAIEPGKASPLIETSNLLEYGYDSAAMDVALADGRAFFRAGGGIVCIDLRRAGQK